MDLETPLRSECTVSGTLCLVLHISRLIGIAPLKFERVHNGWRIRVSRTFNWYGQALIFIFVFFSIMALTTDLTINKETSFRTNSNSNRFVWVSEIFIVSMVVFSATCTGSNRMRCMIHCLAQLKQINLTLNNFREPSSTEDKKIKLIVTSIIILGSCTILIDFGFYMSEVVKVQGDVLTSSFYLFYNTSSIVLGILVIQLSLITTSVLPTLKSLNSRLSGILQKTYNSTSMLSFAPSRPKLMLIQKCGQTKTLFKRAKFNNRVTDLMTVNINGGLNATPATLHRLSLTYCSLCDVVRLLDASNGLVLVMLFLSFLLHLVITPYHLITGIFHNGPSDHSSTVLQLAWAAYHFGKLLLIIEPCHRTHEQLRLTRYLVSKIRCYTLPDKFAAISELKMFHRHIMLNQVKYFPMQFFTLNRSIIVGIMGSITTYLVVIIQL